MVKLDGQIRKATKAKGSFTSQTALEKIQWEIKWVIELKNTF